MLRGMGKDLGVCNKHNHLLHLAIFFLPVKIEFQLAMFSTILFSKCRNGKSFDQISVLLEPYPKICFLYYL